MTNGEAIAHIKDIICENNTIKPKIVVFEQEKEALYMAIKALEQKPCNDTVSREDAKSFLYERLNRLNNDELYDIFSVIIDDMYNELLAVKPISRQIPVDDSLDACVEKEQENE